MPNHEGEGIPHGLTDPENTGSVINPCEVRLR